VATREAPLLCELEEFVESKGSGESGGGGYGRDDIAS
jgi:hypothetical protein